ncbi:damage-control phosphatase ARMT1 family protein [Streptomyces sp. NPDC051840]|uniref:damage-control phosphatase ARMT1 family protein n=1 Tax=Streptomyces sp. NPDC051840 TaxID=3154752 RepID=UPI00343BEBB6
MGDTRANSEALGAAPHLSPVITCREHGSFAHGVMAERHPELIGRVRGAFPYGPRQHRALDELLDEILHGVVEPLGRESPDREFWAEHGEAHFGRSWFDAPFLWAESYFYRRLLGAVGYFTDGPWRGIDPFAPFKRAELHGETVEEELRSLDGLADLPAEARGEALLQASLWGNRADLGFSGGAASTAGEAVHALVADDSAALWALLPPGSPGTVAVIADNAGRELIPDLVLIDHLLVRGRAARVVLHVKPAPYYVSDATTADVVDCARRLCEAPGQAGEIGARIWAAMSDGRLDVRTHPFFCAPLPYEQMPEDLRADLDAAAVTILKGDLNHRRLVGDRLWPPTTPFAALTDHFPGAVASLRTLKSDVAVGLSPSALERLDASGRAWRTSGTHASVQVRQRRAQRATP